MLFFGKNSISELIFELLKVLKTTSTRVAKNIPLEAIITQLQYGG